MHTYTHCVSPCVCVCVCVCVLVCVCRLLDNLPAATVFTNVDSGETQYEDGFKVGFEVEEQLFLNNHLHFVVGYHSVPGEDGEGEVHRIVGFQVVARRWAGRVGRVPGTTQQHVPAHHHTPSLTVATITRVCVVYNIAVSCGGCPQCGHMLV